MKHIDILALFVEWGFDYNKYKQMVQEIGDICAIRHDKKGRTFRRNYERALLLMAVADHYKSKNIIEIGTGRGFVSGCLSAMNDITSIITIDILSEAETVGVMRKSSLVCLDKVKFVPNSKRKTLDGGFDLAFIDGEHSGSAVKNDFRFVLGLMKKKSIVVFDDYRNKHKGVKKAINTFEYPKTLVYTDGWIYENRMITKHKDADKVIDGKESGSGQVILEI